MESTQTLSRNRENPATEFVGRKISHKWAVSSRKNKEMKWFSGAILSVKRGNSF